MSKTSKKSNNLFLIPSKLTKFKHSSRGTRVHRTRAHIQVEVEQGKEGSISPEVLSKTLISICPMTYSQN